MMSSDASQIRTRKEWEDAHHGRRDGNQKWTVWVVLLICKFLVNGIPPAAIPANIQTMYETLHGKPTDDPPSISFVRECPAIVEVMGDTLTAIKLAGVETWSQLWTDATTRRQIPFTSLIIGLLGDKDNIDPVIVSLCMFIEDKQSDTGAEGIIDQCYSDRASRQK